MDVVLYSTGCPKCKVLEAKLSSAGVAYSIVSDVDVMTEKGFMSAPVLEVDGLTYDFTEAVQWVRGLTWKYS